MLKRLLLATAFAAPLPAIADTVTIGYFDPGAGMSGIQVLGSSSGTSPIVTLQGTPHNNQVTDPAFMPTGVTGFGFDTILAMVIPPGGNSLSGGLGGIFPTFEFMFSDGFVPPQGGTAYLYATWQGTFTGSGPITMPTQWGAFEMPKVQNGYNVTSQVLICNTPNPFCGPFVGGISQPGGFAGQDQFLNTLRTDDITLSAILPGQNFKITEMFAFSGNAGPPQGDVGAFQMTTLHNPIPVPGPIVGMGLPGLVSGLLGMLFLWRRKMPARQ